MELEGMKNIDFLNQCTKNQITSTKTPITPQNANGNQFFKSKKNNQKFGKLIKNFHENPYNPLNKHLSKTPLSTSQINLSNKQNFESERKIKTPINNHFHAPSKNPNNLKISNFINNNNLSNISQINSFFAYSPKNQRLNQSSNNIKKLITGIQRETLKNNNTFQQRKKILFDRKLTPDPFKKTIEIKRNLTPSKNCKNSQNVLQHQLFIKTNNIPSLPYLKPQIFDENFIKKGADIKKFEKLFQKQEENQVISSKNLKFSKKIQLKNFSPYTHQNFNNLQQNNNNLKFKQKNPNVPQILEIFYVLTKIKTAMKQNENILPTCKEYLAKLIKLDLNFYEKIVGDINDKVSLRKTIILERIVILIVLNFSFKNGLNIPENPKIYSLIDKIHENLLIILKQLYNLDPTIKQNLAEYLSENIHKSPQNLSLLNQNIDFLINELKSCCYETTEPFITIAHILNHLDIFSIYDASHSLLECFERVISNVENIAKKGVNADFIILESPLKTPFLPPLENKQYTLVLDLDETLVHYQELKNNTGQFLIRPYVEIFLMEMKEYYEIVVFTAATQDYADWILDVIDTKKCISHRLYRDHALTKGSHFLKDLSKLGRDLKKIIIIDNLAENFELQPENGIFIQSWYGDPEDRALFELAPLLKEIVRKKVDDVRVALNIFREQLLYNIQNGITEPHKYLNLEHLD